MKKKIKLRKWVKDSLIVIAILVSLTTLFKFNANLDNESKRILEKCQEHYTYEFCMRDVYGN